ncbi:recombinase family protein [Acetobacterium wieringae]|uniref:Recombinase family protein n=1 Tax=Acetobacterium wieringae TaxID=52694 RepID=A0ABY6HLS5_9FIRM|nr:recombinase family protein [Acetobacterium wieringae]UYO64369.1 recombinase family protein [Acetobacterium wieringae]VUZ27146.1 Uncharacterised protein [Acetobacterium wieringae]
MNAVIYARYSSNNQREESIDAQIRAIEEYASHNAIRIIGVYTDEAQSARTDNRPNFLRMVKDSGTQKFQAVLVHKLDRFSRDRYDSAFYKNLLKKNGVKIISVLERLDDSPESVILESVLEGINEYYSRNLSREVMKGMKETAFQCKHNGGVPPLGYDVAPDKTYIINESEAKVVRLIFKMYVDEYGYNHIIDTLNEYGYRTKVGNTFGKNSIHDLLKNEKYTGTYIFNKTQRKIDGKRNGHLQKDESEIIRVENGIPAIIDKETFNQVKEKMITNKHRNARFSAKEDYLLSGLIFCGSCGKSMYGKRRFAGRNKSLYVTYECSTRKRLRTCKMKGINRDYVEDLVIQQLEDEIFSPEAIDRMADLILNYSKKIKSSADVDLNNLQKELKALDKQINNIVDAIANGMFHESMKVKMDSLEKQKSDIIASIEQIEMATQKSSYSKKEIEDYFLKDANIREKSPEDQKKIIQTYIERIDVYEDRIDIKNIVTLIV